MGEASGVQEWCSAKLIAMLAASIALAWDVHIAVHASGSHAASPCSRPGDAHMWMGAVVRLAPCSRQF